MATLEKYLPCMHRPSVAKNNESFVRSTVYRAHLFFFCFLLSAPTPPPTSLSKRSFSLPRLAYLSVKFPGKSVDFGTGRTEKTPDSLELDFYQKFRNTFDSLSLNRLRIAKLCHTRIVISTAVKQTLEKLRRNN